MDIPSTDQPKVQTLLIAIELNQIWTVLNLKATIV